MTDDKPKRGKGPLTPYEAAEKIAGLLDAFDQDSTDAVTELEEKLALDKTALLDRVPQDERELAHTIIEAARKARANRPSGIVYELGEDLYGDVFKAGTRFEVRLDGCIYLEEHTVQAHQPEREDGA